MIKNKITILTAVGILMWGVFVCAVANASATAVSISPTNLDKAVNEVFVVAASINPEGAKVCALEGKVLFDKVSCQNIVLGVGVVALKMPSCEDTSFLLGLPSCDVALRTLFTIIVKAEEVGVATINFAGIDVIGEGFSLPFMSSGAVFNLSKIPAFSAVKTEIDDEPILLTTDCVCSEWGEWQGNSESECGQGGCLATQLLQTRDRECAPTFCEIEAESRCVEDVICASAGGGLASTQGATILDALGFDTGGYGWWLLGILLIVILIILISRFVQKRRGAKK